MALHVIGSFGGLVKWDHASMAWMSQEFDSPILHHLRSISVAVNTSPCHGEDHGFDSRMLRQRSLRLSVRTRGFHPRKRGSTPLGTANKICARSSVG